jgi:hypothetical protein
MHRKKEVITYAEEALPVAPSAAGLRGSLGATRHATGDILPVAH